VSELGFRTRRYRSIGGTGIAIGFGIAFFGFVCAGLREARANATEQTEEQRVAEVLQSTLVAHGGEVHRCFEKALADTLNVAGRIELAVDVGDEGRITKAVPEVDEVKSPVLLACLQETAQLWTMAGIDAGSTVIVPLTFEGQINQFSIKAADAPDRGPPAPARKRKGLQVGVPPYSVKLLVDEATMHAKRLSLSLLTVSPANRIAMHKHPGVEVLYLLKGHARVIGPQGASPENIREGTAVYIPAGMPHAIENMGRSAPAVMLEIFSPLGPERVYRDPKDETGRAAFEVIRDPRKAITPEGAHFVVASAAKAGAHAIAGGKGKVRFLLDEESTGDKSIYVGLLEVEPGAEIARHAHAGSEETLFVLSGDGGELTVGSDKIRFGAEQAIHLPDDQPHAIKFHGDSKTVMLQVYTPAGPEQRFKGEGKVKTK
jgi:quercetin dioxygenase-like cupin family protein